MIVGTAGHIDHGKSALVEALTGVNPDRLPEERRRGMTLDLGFGHLALGPGWVAGIVDVPGHERFIHTMVAGAGAVDVLLLVVAADSGVQPQTEEHIELCRLLGLRQGVVALTKCDLADAARQAVAREQIARRVQGTFLERAPVVAVSARTGEGLEALRQALAAAAGASAPRPAAGPVRLPVDRVFQMRGFGMVATGTLLEGTLRRGAELEALPGGARLRARRVQVHGEEVEAARAGERTAVNLAGDAELARGSWLVEPGVFRATQLLDAELQWAAGAEPAAQRAELRLLLHTAQAVATVYWLEAPYAQLRLSAPMVAVPGDRFILRQLSPARTLGGGVVLEAQPERHRTAARAAAADALRTLAASGDPAGAGALAARLRRAGADGVRLEALAAAVGGRAAELRAQLAGMGAALLEHPAAAMEAEAMAGLESALLAALERFHLQHPLEDGATLAQLHLPAAGADSAAWQSLAAERLRDAGRVEAGGGRWRRRGHQPRATEAQSALRQAIEQHFLMGGLSPPPLEAALRVFTQPEARVLVQTLLREGTLVECQPGWLVHAHALRDLQLQLRERRSAGAATFTVADFKQWTGLTRKTAIPLLEYLDRARLTRRRGDAREICA